PRELHSFPTRRSSDLAVGRAEDGGVFHAGVNRVGIGKRRLQMPHPLELPGMLRAVVPLMRGERLAGFGRRVVGELVAVSLGRARDRKRTRLNYSHQII